MGVKLGTHIKGQRLMIFENRVLENMCRTNGDRNNQRWGKVCNKELRDLHSLPHVIRVVN